MAAAEIGIRIGVDGAAQTEAQLNRVAGGFDSVGRSADAMRSILRSASGALAGGFSAAAFVQAADSVTRLQNSLALVSGSAAVARESYAALFDIAQRSRVSFTELGGTFATIVRATEDLKLSQKDLLTLTEAIGNAVTISGGSAQSAQAALVQLGQGLASGVLRGEELNSILEQTPRLARALADGLGVSVGQLRQLGQEGRLTAESVVTALRSQSAALADEVGRSVLTVGQAFTQLQNSAVNFIGEIDRTSGATANLAAAAQVLSASLDDIGTAFRDSETQGASFAAFGGVVSTVLETVAVLGANVSFTLRQIGNSLGATAAQAAAIARGDFAAVREIGRLAEEDAKRARAAVDALSARILASRGASGQPRPTVVDEKDIERTKKFEAEIARLRAEISRLVGSSAAAKKSVSTMGDEFATQRDAAKEYARAIEDFRKINADASASTDGLSKAQARLVEYLGSPAYQQHTDSMREIVVQEGLAAIATEQTAEAQRAATRAIDDRIKAAQGSANSAEQALADLERENDAAALAASSNISLAKAIETVTISRLEEARAALVTDPARAAELAAIDREIAARRRLRDAIGSKEAREAAARAVEEQGKATKAAADEAEQEWKRTSEQIERSLTDALMRGFEDGKGFAQNLKDTVVNMFKTMVLRPIIQGVVQPVAGAVTSAFMGGGGPGSPGSSVMSMIPGATSLAGAGGIAGLGQAFVAGGSLSAAEAAAAAAAYTEAGFGATATAIELGSALGPIAAAAPYLLAAAVVATALMGERGGPKTGGSGILSSTGADVSSLDRLFTPSQRDAEAQAFAANVVDSVRATVSDLGGTIGDFTVGIGFDLDPEGTAPNRISSFLSTAIGDAMRNVDLDLGRDDASLQRGLGLEVQRLIIAGLQVSDLPSQIASIFAGVDAATATQEQVNATFAAAKAMDTLLETASRLSIPLVAVTEAMTSAAGGVEALTAGLGTYISNFYSAEEQFALGMEEITRQFRSIGLETVPQTREGFRDLVESLDLTTEAGQSQYGALIALSGAFAQLIPATETAAEVVEEVAQVQRASAAEIADLYRTVGLEAEAAAIDNQLLAKAFKEIGLVAPRTREELQRLVLAASPEQAAVIAQFADTLAELPSVFAPVQDAFDELIQRLSTSAADALALTQEWPTRDDWIEYYARAGFEGAAALLAEEYAADWRLAWQSLNLDLPIPTTFEEFDAVVETLRQAALAGTVSGNTLVRVLGLADEFARQLPQTIEEIVAPEPEMPDGRTPVDQPTGDDGSAQRIADERYRLETQLLQVQGDTVALRARELSQLDPSNRAIQQRIWALDDEKAAAEVAAQAEREAAEVARQAAEDAQRAAKEVADAWRAISDSLLDEVRRIRGEIVDGSGRAFAALQAEFAIATAAARAGDREAAESLTGLARQVIDAGAAQAATLLDAQRLRAAIADSLQATSEIVNPDAPRVLEPIAPPPPDADFGGMERVGRRIDALREDQRAQASASTELLLRVARLVEQWDGEGLPTARTEA